MLRGLRNVLVYVRLSGVFPPPSNSPDDVALVRAANVALRRQAIGITDAILFVIAEGEDSTSGSAAIHGYGFAEGTVTLIGIKGKDAGPERDPQELQEDIARVITTWLAKEHPDAIAFPSSEYDTSTFWWTGVEHQDALFDWPFSGSDFASILPFAHSTKADTWLALLGHATDLEDAQALARDGVAQQRAAVIAATLSEWLHGFEGASGNSWNHFDGDAAIQTLGLSDFFLGFEAASLSGVDLDDFCVERDADVDDISGAALTAITAGLRSEMQSSLSALFGSDAALFWALHSAIWPQFDRPMVDAWISLLSPGCLEERAELEAPWIFVTEGWHESANA